MSNPNFTAALNNFRTPARRLGLVIPEQITAALAPDAHPRAQLNAHLEGILSIPEAVHAALNAGNNPHTDQGVADSLKAQQIRSGAGDLDTVNDQRVSAAFREHWDALVDAVDALYAPAAQALTEAHEALTEAGLEHSDTDGIRRAGGPALVAWANSLAAAEVYAYTPQIMTHASLIARPHSGGGRAHWLCMPNLDTWVREVPNLRDPWAVLASGATLDLARTLTDAEARATLVAREQQLANEARRGAVRRGGQTRDSQGPVHYIGADGKTRTTDADGMIRGSHNGGAPTHVVNAPDGLVNL